MSAWCFVCNGGIGVRCSDIYPYLDEHKCYLAVQKLLPDEEIDEAGFELKDYLNNNAFSSLGHLIACLLDDQCFLYCDTYDDNGDLEPYIVYPPSYPWDRVENEPQSVADVHERIVRALLMVTNLTPEEAEQFIVNDVCGDD